MATRKQFEAAVKLHGATIEEMTGRSIGFNVDAPDKFVWASTGEHCLTCCVFRGPGAAAEVYRDLIDGMGDGVKLCTDPECEYCHPVPEHLIGT